MFSLFRWAVIAGIAVAAIGAILMIRGGGEDIRVQTAEVTTGPIVRHALLSQKAEDLQEQARHGRLRE